MKDLNSALCVSQAVTASAVTTDYYDAQTARDMGLGCPLVIEVFVNTTPTAGSSTALNFELRADSSSTDIATVGTTCDKQMVVASVLSADYATTLAAGKTLVIPIPPGFATLRYWNLKFTAVTGSIAAGVFSAYIVPDAGKQINYASGYTVSS